MSLINLILNLAGLLLWLAWVDAVRPPPLAADSPLARTLRRTGSSKWEQWKNLCGLAGLLLGRTVIYWWVGPAVNWTPAIKLVVVIPFRSEFFGRMLLFSLASFAMTLAVFYLIILFFSLVNRRVPDSDPLQKFVRYHMGRVEDLAWPVKLMLPFLVVLALWFGLHPALVRWDIIPPASSFGAMFGQSALISVDACLVWRHAAAAVLLLHFLSSYVYFGNHPGWGFAKTTAQQILRVIPCIFWVLLWPVALVYFLINKHLPRTIVIGKMDLTPIIGVAIFYFLGELLIRLLPRIYPA